MKLNIIVMLIVGFLCQNLNAAPPPIRNPYGTYEMAVIQGSQTSTVTITNQPLYGLPTVEFINTEKQFIGAGGINYLNSPWMGRFDHVTKYGPLTTYDYHWQGDCSIGQWTMVNGYLSPEQYLHHKSGELLAPSDGGQGSYFNEGTSRRIVRVKVLYSPADRYPLYAKVNSEYSIYRSGDQKYLTTRSRSQLFAYPEQFNQLLLDSYNRPVYRVTEVDLVYPPDKSLNNGLVTIVLDKVDVTMVVDTAPPQ